MNDPGHQRIRLTIAYDGRPFTGWQFSGDGKSVQEQLESAAARILKSKSLVRIHASGRTDAGVHALGQVVHFDAPPGWRMDGPAWCRALHCFLPPSIRVLDAAVVEPDFHARKQASGKVYRYRLFHGPVLHPLDHGFVGHWPWPLDFPRMQDAAEEFLGTHDFSAFAAYRHDGTDRTPESGGNTREIRRVALVSDGAHVTIELEGSGFLYKMVRLMVGALIHAGRGSLDRNGIRRLLECHADATGRLIKSPLCAPADGLYLVRVLYPPKDHRED